MEAVENAHSSFLACAGLPIRKKVNIPEPLKLPNGFFDRQRKARLLKALEPKRHIKKLLTTMKLRSNTHGCELTRRRNGVENHTFPASQIFHERITSTIMNFNGVILLPLKTA